MKIAIVSKLWEPTSPDSIGGTGAAVGYLVAELRRRGHEVFLFSTSDSMTSGKLFSSVSSTEFRRCYSEAQEYLNIAQAFDRRHSFDIIHCHNEFKSLFNGAASATPSLHTVRYGEFFSDELKVFDSFRQLNFAGISRAVSDMLPNLNWRGFVYNGLDITKFNYREQKEDYLLFLARLSPQKGPDVAIRVANKLGRRLILAGKRSGRDADYLKNKVDPYIDGDKVIYMGEVDFSTKVDLLSKASCLLHPISYLEAFGMTLIEAMACGTPVISYAPGAISEVIADQKTGFVVNSETEMIAAVGQLSKIKSINCRQRVEDNFTASKMADGYEKIYQEILK